MSGHELPRFYLSQQKEFVAVFKITIKKFGTGIKQNKPRRRPLYTKQPNVVTTNFALFINLPAVQPKQQNLYRGLTHIFHIQKTNYLNSRLKSINNVNNAVLQLRSFHKPVFILVDLCFLCKNMRLNQFVQK